MPMRYDAECPLIPTLLGTAGRCDLASCGKPLLGRRRRWCSDACATIRFRAIYQNHEWGQAREAALKRDGYRCRHCSWAPNRGRRTRFLELEVNHIRPLAEVGVKHAMAGCHHHLDNLETLCHDCHAKVTAAQARARADRRRNRIPLGLGSAS
jgi:5-methylcytosine-specific restriction endonuclease McrA